MLEEGSGIRVIPPVLDERFERVDWLPELWSLQECDLVMVG